MENASPKVFIYDRLTVYFKHTDYHGFVHPYNFLEWTSYVREAFFSEICHDFHGILDSPVKMMTAKIACRMNWDSVFGDVVEARFTTSRIKKVSFDVIVHFYDRNLEKIVCETQHTLVFIDSRTQEFTTIPKGIRDAIVEYEEASS